MKEKIMVPCLLFSRAAYKFILLIVVASEICNEIYAHSWMLRICCLASFALLMVAILRERKFAFPSTDDEWYGYLKRLLSWPLLVTVLVIYIANMRNSKESSWFYLFGLICQQSVLALFLLRYWFMTVMLNERMKSEKGAESK